MENITRFNQISGGSVRLRRPVWDDMKYPASGLNPPGAASDPTRDTTDGMLLFDAAATNVIAGGALMPHAREVGTVIEPHIHWTATTTGAGNVVWRFEYAVASIGNAFPAYTTVNVTAAASGVANQHQVTSFGEITMADDALGTMLKWKLSRIGGDAADTYAADAKLLEFDIHIQLDSFGSEEKYSKR